MRQVIVTGASGFVGQNLIHYFQQRNLWNVIPLSLREGIPVDFKPADAIIHLAGKAHDLKKANNFQEYFDVNYGLTRQLFDRFLISGIKDFIYISSVKAVADNIEGVLTEDVVPNPKTPYGQSKLKAEEYLLSKILPANKRLFILRPSMIHGPENKGNLNLLYKFVSKGIPYPLAAFENKRSFLSIENLCFVIEELLEGNILSCTYNVADDEALSINEVVTILSQVLNKKAKLWPISSKLIHFLAKVGDKISLPLTTERLHKLTENYMVSNNKIKNALGVEFPLSSREGLKRTAESFKNRNKS